METNQQPTIQEIEVLTAFLPRLYAEDFSPVINWEGGKQTAQAIHFLHCKEVTIYFVVLI